MSQQNISISSSVSVEPEGNPYVTQIHPFCPLFLGSTADNDSNRFVSLPYLSQFIGEEWEEARQRTDEEIGWVGGSTVIVIKLLDPAR